MDGCTSNLPKLEKHTILRRRSCLESTGTYTATKIHTVQEYDEKPFLQAVVPV